MHAPIIADVPNRSSTPARREPTRRYERNAMRGLDANIPARRARTALPYCANGGPSGERFDASVPIGCGWQDGRGRVASRRVTDAPDSIVLFGDMMQWQFRTGWALAPPQTSSSPGSLCDLLLDTAR